tara:strand:+ start:1993 stop:3252 length:1260 start_codon:yes stop_codon:yes gene_type:complete
MISQPFIFTDHANDRFKERFSNLKKTVEVKNLSHCNKKEVTGIKASKAHNEIKKSRRNKFYYYKSNNNVYFVCESKPQGKKDIYYANVVVTVVDFTEEDESKITDSFREQMLEGERRLFLADSRIIGKAEKPKKKKKKKLPKEERKKMNNNINTKTLSGVVDELGYIRKLKKGKTIEEKMFYFVSKINNSLIFNGKDTLLKVEDFQNASLKKTIKTLEKFVYVVGAEENFENYTQDLDSLKENLKEKSQTTETKKAIGYMKTLGNELKDCYFNMENIGFQKILDFFLEINASILNNKIRCIESLYSSRPIPYEEYREFVSYAKCLFRFSEYEIIKFHYDKFIDLLSEYQLNTEFQHISTTKKETKYRRIFDNIQDLKFFLNIDTTENKKKENILNFYTIILDNISKTETKSLVISKYLT